MIKLSKYYTNVDKNIFVFDGDVRFMCYFSNEDANTLIEVYDTSRTPAKILSEIFICCNEKAHVKLYNCEKRSVENIINTELEGHEIEYEDANYIYDKNKWLLSFVEESDVKIMRIDDEHLTFDGMYLHEERIFNKENRLIEVKEYYNDKNGHIVWEAESYE